MHDIISTDGHVMSITDVDVWMSAYWASRDAGRSAEDSARLADGTVRKYLACFQ